MNTEWLGERNRRLFETESPVALVTGSAADRVGRRIAELFMNCGFRVAFHSHADHVSEKWQSYTRGLKQAGHEFMVVSGAIEKEEYSESWLKQTLDRWGRVDVLVNSAAIWESKPLDQTTAEDLRRQWEVNCLGSFMAAKQFGLQMTRQASGGAIIHVGDWAVARPYPDFAAYFISKGSIETMTRTLAVELASCNPNVRVNAVMPGPVMLADNTPPEKQRRIIRDSLLQRAGDPRDVAEAVYFLATSPFVTGVCLPVDGGRSIFCREPPADSMAHPG